MNGGEWHSIDRYDEALKQDENVACVGYDSRTGIGLPDAHFIVKAVNNHDEMLSALHRLTNELTGQWVAFEHGIREAIGNTNYAVVAEKLEKARQVLGHVGSPRGQP